jgi:hypothetical protein
MSRPAVAALSVLGVVVVVLVLAQLMLPGIAADRIRSDLAQQGSGIRADVSAFPAIKLLWRQADRVSVSVDELRMEGGSEESLADRLVSTKATKRLDVSVGVLDAQLLRLRDVRLRKDGDGLIGSVRLTREDVDEALPPDLGVAGRATSDGQLAVSGATEAFGRRVAARARILVDERGRIVIRPEGIPLGALVSVPVFSDERVAVDALDARSVGDGFEVTARGRLR